MSVKSLDPDQALCFVKSNLGPNCLQRVSAEMTLAGEGLNIKVPTKIRSRTFTNFVLSLRNQTRLDILWESFACRLQ